MATRDPNARVTPEQVMDIISTSLTEGQINAMINTAHLVVEQTLADQGLDSDLLTQIELWLSAHYVCMRDPQKESVKVDEVQVKYHRGRAGTGLDGSTYGQQAIALDPTGSLASASLKKAVISVE